MDFRLKTDDDQTKLIDGEKGMPACCYYCSFCVNMCAEGGWHGCVELRRQQK